MTMFDIIRFYSNGKKKLVHYLVSKEQAMEWCNSPFTRKGSVYFDGFAKSGSYKTGKAIYDHYFTPTIELN